MRYCMRQSHRLNLYKELTMAEENLNENASAPEPAREYQAPAIEEVVTRDGIEREVAYAGVIGPSQVNN